jgi:hypothetical protein
MLNVPTLWTVFVINFLALGLVWAYVARSYPKFDAARFWTAAALAAAIGVALSMLHGVLDSRLPLVGGGILVISACCLATMGIERFYGKPASWRAAAVITALSGAGLAFFLVVQDNMPMRILIFSLGQSIPMVATLKLVLARRDGRDDAGARLAGIVAILILVVHVVRSGCALLQIGGEVSMVSFAGLQAGLILVQVFLSMAWNFGFLLMAIDRLRNEVADLALLSVAAPDRGMRPVGAQRRAVRALGDRSRRLQGDQRHPRPRRRRRLPAAFHPDGADPAAARRHAGAHRRR